MTVIGEAPIPLATALQDITNELLRQQEKHGDQTHLPNGTGPEIALERAPVTMGSFMDLAAIQDAIKVDAQWDLRADHLAEWAKIRCKAASENEGGDGSITYEHILTEEWAEAITEEDPALLRKELVQLASVAVAWIMKIDKETNNAS